MEKHTEELPIQHTMEYMPIEHKTCTNLVVMHQGVMKKNINDLSCSDRRDNVGIKR